MSSNFSNEVEPTSMLPRRFRVTRFGNSLVLTLGPILAGMLGMGWYNVSAVRDDATGEIILRFFPLSQEKITAEDVAAAELQ